MKTHKTMNTNLQWKEAVKAAIAREFEVEEDCLLPENSLAETLDLDSLSLLDLVKVTEDATGVKIQGTDVKNIRTFSDLYDYLEARL